MRAPVTPDEPEPDPIDSYVEQALKAFTDATDVAGLYAAYKRHTCATSPLALARRRIAELPVEDRTDTAKRIGFGFARLNVALFERERFLGIRL